MRFFIAVALASLSLVAAQTTTSSASPSIPSCVLTCVTPAATEAGCGSFANLTCVCTSTQFQSLATACLTANCTTSDQQAAVQLQQSLCASLNATSSGATGTATATGSAASNTKPATTSSTATAKPSSGAGTLSMASTAGIIVSVMAAGIALVL